LEVLTLKTLVTFELDGRDVLCFSTSKTSTRYEISEKIIHCQMLVEAFDADSNKDRISMQATCVTLKMQTQFVQNRRFVYFIYRKLADSRKIFVTRDEQRRRRQCETEQIPVLLPSEPRRTVQIDIEKTFGSREIFTWKLSCDNE
jgi:hypothetical protein